MIRNKLILVIGGSGFIGTRLCLALLEQGNDVVVFDGEKKENTDSLVMKGAAFMQGSVNDRKRIADAMENAELVFHLAGADLSEEKKQGYRSTVVLGAKNVFDAAVERKIERLVTFTPGAVLGDIQKLPGNEDTPYNPGNALQQANMEMKLLGRRYYEDQGLPLVTIRSCGIYGPGDRKHLLLFKIMRKGIFPIIEQNQRKRDMVYVDDFVQALLLAAEKEKAVGKLYHVTHEWVTIEAMAGAIADIMGLRPRYITIPTKPLLFFARGIERASKILGIRPFLFRRRMDFFLEKRYLDSSKIRRELGFSPQTDYRTGLKKTYDWYRQEGWL